MSEFDSVEFNGDMMEFDTGAKRENKKGRGRFDLLPPHATLRDAKHIENGIADHGERNWEGGIPFSSLLDSAEHHLIEYKRCKTLNLPIKEDHLSAIRWNIGCIVEEEERIALGLLPASLDDLQGASLTTLYFQDVSLTADNTTACDDLEYTTLTECRNKNPKPYLRGVDLTTGKDKLYDVSVTADNETRGSPAVGETKLYWQDVSLIQRDDSELIARLNSLTDEQLFVLSNCGDDVDSGCSCRLCCEFRALTIFVCSRL